MSTADLAVIVLNNACSAQGGASRVAIDEAVGLSRRGVRVTFVGAGGPVGRELAEAPLDVICMDQPELADAAGRPGILLQGLWNIKAYRTLAGLLDKMDPHRTIVHMHGFTQALSTSVVRCALARSFRLVYTMHDFFAACPNGAFFDYVAGKPCDRTGLSPGCVTTNCDKRHYSHKLYRVARSATQRTIGRFPSGVHDYIALSERSRRMMQQYLPPDARIHAIANPIDVTKAPPVDVARNRSVIAVGRLDTEKGVAVLVEAAEKSGTPVTFVGDGPLRGLVEASNVCRVTGWLQREAVMREIESARALAFPSICYETFGLAVAEAAARGVPAIVSDISAAAERMEDGISGWHVRAGDMQDLIRCLTILRSDDAVSRVGRAAYEQFWAHPFTPDQHVSELLETYERILRTSGSTP